MGAAGTKPFYAEECSAILASAFSSGRYPDPYMVTTSVNNSCTTGFSGTSSSVSVAGGVLALALQANPSLTWRDMQHLIVQSARQDTTDLNEAKWIRNAAGIKFSTTFGFGLLDALRLVQKAASWSPVGDQRHCTSDELKEAITVQPQTAASAAFMLLGGSGNCAIKSAEHVLLVVNMTAYRRGDIMAQLTSPSGTKVTILEESRYDIALAGFENKAILSLATWGENPQGIK